MNYRVLATALAITATGATASEARAPAAAETAIITSGTGAPQARAARGLGSAISGAMRRSSGAIRVQPRGVRRGAPRQGQEQALPEGDPLEGTDAPAYTLGNGTTIRVSGGMRNAPSTRCTANCTSDRGAAVIAVGTRSKAEKSQPDDQTSDVTPKPD